MAENVGDREALDALQAGARQRRAGRTRSRVLNALQPLQRPEVVVARHMVVVMVVMRMVQMLVVGRRDGLMVMVVVVAVGGRMWR